MAMASNSAIKLEGHKNWNVWKFQMAVTLKGAELYSVVSGMETKPGNDGESTSKEIAAWVARDAKAQTLIVNRISEAAMVHILTCESAADMWRKLHSVYEVTSATGTLMLQQRFLQYKFEDGDLAVYLAKIQEMICQLRQAGEEISEQFIMTKVLLSLPEAYNHFISAWESVDTSKQNYNDLVSRLLVEEERIKARSKEKESIALYSKQKSVKKCYKCGKLGHITKECKSEDKEKRKCFSCGNVGHLKANCPKREGQGGQQSSDKSKDKSNAFITVTGTAMTTGSDITGSDKRWLIDSGASEHMTSQRSMFTNYLPLSTLKRYVIVGDGRQLPVVGVGDVELSVFNGDCYIKSTLNNVLHVPQMKINLFSVTSATKKGYKVTLTDQQCLFYKDNELCAIGNREGNYYVLEVSSGYMQESVAAVAALSDWHERLCHQNVEYVKKVLKKNNIEYTGDSFQCVSCLEGKMHILPFTRSEQHTKECLELVHADLCGPMEVESIGGSRYFLLIKDDFSNYRVIYFLKHKSETALKIKQFVNWAERQTGNKVKVIRTDNGGEFMNKEIQEFVQEKGIKHQTTIPFTPQQNGKAERDMRTVVEAARSMLKGKGLSKELWAEAVNTTVYVLNRTSKSRVDSQTPYETFHKRSFNVLSLRGVFGEYVYVHIPKEKRLKWDIKGEQAIFVGYDDSKGYRVYYEDKREVHTKRDIVFLDTTTQKETEIKEIQNNENVILLDVPTERNTEEELHDESDDEYYDMDTEQEQGNGVEQGVTTEMSEATEETGQEQAETEGNEVQGRSRRRVKPRYLDDYYLYVDEPRNYKEAMISVEAESWKEAIRRELNQLKENNTWTEIDSIPEGKEVISSKWVLKKKDNSYKARLVARGFEQNCDDDLYAPVAKLNTFRVFVCVATKLGLEINQMDVCGAFLNAHLDEELYLILPEGTDSKYVKLNKSIYGLKKSPKCWNKTFNDVMLSLGYKQSDKDYCLYSKCEGEKKTFLLLYVDDILYFGNDKEDMCKLRNVLCKTFKMKELGNVSKFLGIDVKQDLNKGITVISQKDYLRKLLSQYNILDGKTLKLPIDKNYNFHILKRDSSESIEIESKCRRLVGSLMYAAMGTRPDICSVVNILSRYQSCASELLYKLLLNVLRYVNGTIDLCLVYYRECNEDVLCYVDSDWGGADDRKSTSGCIFKVFGCSVIWYSRKQPTVALSSTEAEYVALCLATSEACWLKEIMLTFGFEVNIIVYEDNQSTIKMAQMATGNSRVKHLEIKQSFIKEKLENKVIDLKYINTSDQLADIFTKALGGIMFRKLRDKLFSK